MAGSEKYSLHYFPIPGAPGELVIISSVSVPVFCLFSFPLSSHFCATQVRVVLVLCGHEWTDEIVAGPQWGVLKPTTLFGQMPVLRTADGRELAQSIAMARFLVKTSKTEQGSALYPADPYQAFRVDMFMDALDGTKFVIRAGFLWQH